MRSAVSPGKVGKWPALMAWTKVECTGDQHDWWCHAVRSLFVHRVYTKAQAEHSGVGRDGWVAWAEGCQVHA